MGEEEKQAIFADVIKRHRDAYNTLGCLRSKAKRMAEDMRIVADILSEESDYLFVGTKDAFIEVDIEDDSFEVKRRRIKWPPSADLESVFSQIAKTTADVKSLEDQMRDQGYGDYIPQ